MLKKLDFKIEIYEFSEFSLFEYNEFLEDISNNPMLYSFYNDTFIFIHLLDDKGKTYYVDIFNLKNKTSNNVYFSYVSAISELKKHDLNIVNIYVSDSYTFYVNINECLIKTNNSKYELEKMYRDITWFDK